MHDDVTLLLHQLSTHYRLTSIPLSNIRSVSSTDPAPINISSLYGSIIIKALPDSGADISAAGTEILRYLNELE